MSTRSGRREFLRDAPSDEPLLWFAPNAPHPLGGRRSPPRRPLRRPPDRRAGLGRRGGRRRQAVVGPPAAAARRCRRIGPAAGAPHVVRDAARRRRGRPGDRRGQAEGELDETLIVYVSDNGLSRGASLGREAVSVRRVHPGPALVRPRRAHRIEPEIVSAADLAPTIVDLAGVAPETSFDGVSLLPLLRHRSRADRTGRCSRRGRRRPRPRRGGSSAGRAGPTSSLAVGERELYDVARDPFELENLADDPEQAARVAEPAAALAAYRDG